MSVSPYVASLIVFGSIYLLLGSSLHVSLSGGQLFAGQVGAMLIASYTTGELALHKAPFLVAALAGVVGAVIGSMIMVALCSRLQEFALAIVSTALTQIMSAAIPALNIFGGAGGLSPVPAPVTWRWALLAALLTMCLLGYFHQARPFRSVLALASDERAAATFGVRIVRTKVALGALSGLLAGVGGVLYAGYIVFLAPSYFSFATFNLILVFAVFGGMWTMWGPLVGVAVLWIIPQYVNFLGNWQLVAYSGFSVLVILVIPDGVAPLLAKAGILLWRLVGGSAPRPTPAVAQGGRVLLKQATGEGEEDGRPRDPRKLLR